MLTQELLGRLTALAEPLGVVGVPGTGLGDDAFLDSQVEEAALLGDAEAVHEIELRLAERRSDLVLDYLGTHAVADDVGALLDRVDPAHVDTDRWSRT